MHIGFLYNELPVDIDSNEWSQFTGALSVDAHLDSIFHGISRYVRDATIYLIDKRDLETIYINQGERIHRWEGSSQLLDCLLRVDYLFISPYAIHSIDEALNKYDVVTTVISIPAIWWYEHPDIYSYKLLEKNISDFKRPNTCFVAPNERICEYLTRFVTLFAGIDISDRLISCSYFVQSFKDRIPSADIKTIVDSGGPWRWTANHIFADAFVEYVNLNPDSKLRFVFSLKDQSNPDHETYQNNIQKIYKGLHDKERVVMLGWSEKGRLDKFLSTASYGLSINLDTIEGFLSSRVRLRDYVSYRLPIITTTENVFCKQNPEICIPVNPDRKSIINLLSTLDCGEGSLQSSAYDDVKYDNIYADNIHTMLVRLNNAPKGVAKLMKTDIKPDQVDVFRGLAADDAARLLQRFTYQLSADQLISYIKTLATDPILNRTLSSPELRPIWNKFLGQIDNTVQLIDALEQFPIRATTSGGVSVFPFSMPPAKSKRDVLYLFEIDPPDLTKIVEGQRPESYYSHDVNIFYLAQEALRLGCRVALQHSLTNVIIEVRQLYPYIELVSSDLRHVSKINQYYIFSRNPQYFRYAKRSVPENITAFCTLVVAATHWLEYPEHYRVSYIDELREAVVYDLDAVIVQNKEMGELFRSLATLVGSRFDRSRIVVAPCGYLPEDESQLKAYASERDDIRVAMGLAHNDIALINSGGVWEWTDLDVFLESFIEFHRLRPENPLKFFIMGMRQPNNQDHENFIRSFIAKLDANRNLLESGAIRMIWDWAEASNCLPRFNHGADVGINVSKSSIENSQSFRQRFVEYVKAGLPVVNTFGDPMSQGNFREMMFLVEAGRKETYLRAMREICDSPDLVYKKRLAAEKTRNSFRTDRIYSSALLKLMALDPISITDRENLVIRYYPLHSFSDIKFRRNREIRRFSEAIESLRFEATDDRIKTEVGTKRQDGILLNKKSGTAIYGPYVFLPSGRYEAVIQFSEASPVTGDAVMDVAAFAGQEILGRSEISFEKRSNAPRKAVIEFTAYRDLDEFEVRLVCSNNFVGVIVGVDVSRVI